MLYIGSHVSYNKKLGFLGSVLEAVSYGSNAFMFYTGAPQNTNRFAIDKDLLNKGLKVMSNNNILIDNVIVHAPYIVNLANNKNIDQYNFSINFIINECKRCEELGVKYLVLHPGNHVGLGIDLGIKNIANALNIILKNTNIMILLETMAGKGTEVGSSFEEISDIISLIDKKKQIGICLDTCHLSDAGYDISNFDLILDKLETLKLLDKVKCVHVNDSKNIKGSHKDRHENIGFGNLGFLNIINIIYNKRLDNIPKILETPWVEDFPPYKFEIEMIRNKKFNSNLKEDIIKYYKSKIN